MRKYLIALAVLALSCLADANAASVTLTAINGKTYQSNMVVDFSTLSSLTINASFVGRALVTVRIVDNNNDVSETPARLWDSQSGDFVIPVRSLPISSRDWYSIRIILEAKSEVAADGTYPTITQDFRVYNGVRQAVYQVSTADYDRVLNWAEANYPQVFPSKATSHTSGDYFYRCYSNNHCLGVTLSNATLVYFDGTLTPLGSVFPYLSTATLAGY